MIHVEELEYGECPTLLSVSSGEYKTELTKKFKERESWETLNPKNIHTAIPGKVLDIFVRVGQEVKKGDVILLLEAMKMQNQIQMPFDGKIKKIYVKPDELIKKNQLMIEIM